MIPNLDSYPVHYLIAPDNNTTDHTPPVLVPFSDEIISALTQLGQSLMAQGRNEPDIVAAGFWLRKTRLLSLKEKYHIPSPRQAKGCVFHIAPGNVDTLFFYSLVISVLCGNYSVLRISNKLSPLTSRLIQLINQFFINTPNFSPVFRLICIIQYEHNDDVTRHISRYADVRVIWGGDKTVARLSKLPIKFNGRNVSFPDRYSVAVFQVNNDNQLDDAAEKLLNDIKPFSQQACSSPKGIYWLNTQAELQEKFWHRVAFSLSKQVKIEASELISQLVYLQRLPLLFRKNPIKHKQEEMLHLVEVDRFSHDAVVNHCGLWILLSQQITELDEINLLSHCQTVTMYGVEDDSWQHWLETTQQPMKRWVAAGQALVFSHVWDGIDLINSFTEFAATQQKECARKDFDDFRSPDLTE